MMQLLRGERRKMRGSTLQIALDPSPPLCPFSFYTRVLPLHEGRTESDRVEVS